MNFCGRFVWSLSLVVLLSACGKGKNADGTCNEEFISDYNDLMLEVQSNSAELKSNLNRMMNQQFSSNPQILSVSFWEGIAESLNANISEAKKFQKEYEGLQCEAQDPNTYEQITVDVDEKTSEIIAKNKEALQTVNNILAELRK